MAVPAKADIENHTLTTFSVEAQAVESRSGSLSIEDLSAELRVEIYRHYFTEYFSDDEEIDARKYLDFPGKWPALLRTSKLVRAEAEPILIREVLRGDTLYFGCRHDNARAIRELIDMTKVTKPYGLMFDCHLELVEHHDGCPFVRRVLRFLHDQIPGFDCDWYGQRVEVERIYESEEVDGGRILRFQSSSDDFTVDYCRPRHGPNEYWNQRFSISGPLMALDWDKIDW